MKNTSKNKSNKIVQQYIIATYIQLKIIKDNEFIIDKDVANSLLFKVYIKNTLMNNKSPLEVNGMYSVIIFNKKISLMITNSKNKENDINEQFQIKEETIIEINNENNDIDNDIKLLNQGFNNLQLEEKEKKLIRNIIEEKYTKYKDEITPIELNIFEEEFQKIQKLIDYNLFSDLSNQNIYFYKGVIISGPSGVGKSYIIKYINSVYKDKINILHLDIYNELLFSNDHNEQVEYIKNIFKFAKLITPSIIIAEDIDRLFSINNKEDENTNTIDYSDHKEKMLYTFIKEIDELRLDHKIMILLSCTNADKLHSDLKKCNRFDYVLQLVPPDQKKRKKLLKYLTSSFDTDLNEEDYEVISDKSHGFVAGDLIQLIKNAMFMGRISRGTIEATIGNIKPINLKEIILDVPKVYWKEIGGNKDVIKKIRNSIEWPLTKPEQLKKIGITSPSGILLYGPPGCSKTMIAKALATESGFNFFAVKGPELFSKYVGDTEKAVRDIFKKAKISSPSIIFFDEIDSMASHRGTDSAVNDKVLCQLLNEMDGIEGREKVVIFGATNRPEILDKALIRPGRFDKLIYIPPPDYEARYEIIRINLLKMCVSEDIDIKNLAEKTEGYSGAEITELCKSAGMLALEEDIDIDCVKLNHFYEALKHVKPQITKEMIKFYREFADNLNNI